jgi:hypothetical protein
MNANEIVRALRLCGETTTCITERAGCPYQENTDDCKNELLFDAADLIESLQAQLAEYDALAAEYGIDGKTMLTLAKSQIRTAQDNVELMEQLEESQRRADKAVEDLTKLATKPIVPCQSCAKTCLFPASLAPECQPPTWCREWQWRGQEAGEGGHAETEKA